MEKQRQTKILSIIALMLAITGMTLGFAAFSTSLSISSNASVSPNSSDFSVKIVSDDGSKIIKQISGNAVGGDGIISDDGLYISNIHVTFSKLGDMAGYMFKVENNGLYDAYVEDFGLIDSNGSGSFASCTAADNTLVSSELLNETCKSISSDFVFFDSENNNIYERDNVIGTILRKGESHTFYIYFSLSENGVLPDGDVVVSLDDIYIKYNTYVK